MYTDYDVCMALGELALTKVAGEIDNDAFDYYADSLVKEARRVNNSIYKKNTSEGRFVSRRANAPYGDLNTAKADLAQTQQIRAMNNPRKSHYDKVEVGEKNPMGKKFSEGAGAASTPAKMTLWDKAKDFVTDGAKAKSIRAGWAKGEGGKRAWGTLAKGLGKTGLVYGAPLGALGYGAYRLAKD